MLFRSGRGYGWGRVADGRATRSGNRFTFRRSASRPHRTAIASNALAPKIPLKAFSAYRNTPIVALSLTQSPSDCTKSPNQSIGSVPKQILSSIPIGVWSDSGSPSCVDAIAVGLIGVLIDAKENRHVEAIQPHLDTLQQAGFWISDQLYRRVLRDEGELP